MTRSFPATVSPALAGEATSAQVLTAIPGPKSEQLRARHGQFQDARTIHFYTDSAKSFGNYLVDADGNRLLDLYGHIAALPLGYNHPALISAWKEGRFDWAAGWRPSLGVSPPVEWVSVVEAFLEVAPPGLTGLLTVTTGAEALENAFKIAFIEHARRRRVAGGGAGGPTAGDMQDCMRNAQVSANNMKILSFTGAFHGRTLGALSATRSKAIHKVDFPAFDWPVVPFPINRFPQSEFARENNAEEARSLELVEAAFRADPGAIAAVVIEPIQGEGGDCHASPAFYQALQKITHDHGALFIVDEVQTGGGACGTWWMHPQLGVTPDIVTFSKKFQVGGCFFRRDLMPAEPYRIFNTFLGDPLRAAQMAVVIETVKQDQLLENTRITGEYLVAGLEDLARRYPNLISQGRGVGTYAAFDLPSAGQRDQLVKLAQAQGLEVGGSGLASIRFRPALIFAPRHAAEALDRLETALQGLVR